MSTSQEALSSVATGFTSSQQDSTILSDSTLGGITTTVTETEGTTVNLDNKLEEAEAEKEAAEEALEEAEETKAAAEEASSTTSEVNSKISELIGATSNTSATSNDRKKRNASFTSFIDMVSDMTDVITN